MLNAEIFSIICSNDERTLDTGGFCPNKLILKKGVISTKYKAYSNNGNETRSLDMVKSQNPQ